QAGRRRICADRASRRPWRCSRPATRRRWWSRSSTGSPRSLLDFAGLMATAQRQGWGVIALDVQVDTSTASGEAMANTLATFAQFERRLIGQRTREALEVKKASGVRLGRPPLVPQSVGRRIQRGRAPGQTLR